jgi:Uma2 family endonuclease
MEAHRSHRRWTWTEFARLPSAGGTRHEVIAGELFVTPAPGLTHQAVVTDLVTLLNSFVRRHELGRVFSGPVDVLLAEGDYLEPDIVFVRAGREGLLTERGIEGPPDLVVEVVSPSTESRDRGLKLDRYRRFGVGEYWVVDPGAGEVEVWSLAAGTTEPRVVGRSDVLRWSADAGAAPLEVRLADLFAG